MRELTRRRFAVPAWAPRSVEWWAVLAMIAVGAVIMVMALAPSMAQYPGAAAMGLMFSVMIGVGWWWLLRIPQLWARIASSGALLALAWGALAATGAYALPANGALIMMLAQYTSLDFTSAWAPALVAPLTEEPAKVFAVIAVLLVSAQRLRTPMDAALLGAFGGVGFTVTEDLLYTLNVASLNLGENEAITSLVVLFARTLLFPSFSHVVLSAFVGAGLGLLVLRGTRGWLPAGVALIMLGVGLHWLWNSPLLLPLWPRFLLVAVLPFLVWWGIHALRRTEHAWFVRVLSADGALGAVPREYLDAVPATWRLRRRRRAQVVRAFGRGAVEPQRLLEARLTDLADAVDVGDQQDADRLRAALATQLGATTAT